VTSQTGLAARFREHVHAGDALQDGDGVVVALSGGLDSVVLLHLLRFTEGLPALSLHAVHLDHGMRTGSSADASWVRGLTRAWGVPLRVLATETVPSSEDEARELRYAFFEDMRAEAEARWVVTAHHLDDQVETVLFRILRGTGLRGLRGIPEYRAPGIWRPLLPFSREDIEAHALTVGIHWREDPTNAEIDFARNAIRNRILPDVEDHVAPGARSAILRLARLARQEEDAWESLLPELVASLDAAHAQGELSFSRDALVRHDPALRARLLQSLARRFGGHLDAAGTRIAVEFTSSGESGREVSLTGALRLRRELDRLVLAPDVVASEVDCPVAIDGESGTGRLRVGGVEHEVVWGGGEVEGRWTEAFDGDALEFPIVVRAWTPGDRIHFPYGSKKLKKVFLEARLGRKERDRAPVVVDARGQVLWIPGIARSDLAQCSGSTRELKIGVTNAHID
jgi:tRNA(Ile)-lysidine synthase